MSHLREARHLHYFNDYELAALAPALTRLDIGLGDLTQAELMRLLMIAYSLPAMARDDQRRCLAGLTLATQALGTFLRYEIDAHSSNPDFCEKVLSLTEGILPALIAIRARAERGPK